MTTYLAHRLCAALTTCLVLAAGAHAATPAPQLFSPTSVWNAPLAANAPLDPSSAALVAHLNAFVQSNEQQKIGPWVNTTSYSTPLYIASAQQATVPVYTEQGFDSPLSDAFAAVPLPAGVQPAAGSDAQLTVYQPSADTLWEFYKLSRLLPAPGYLSAASSSGGSLPAGTYDYAVSALTPTGQTTVGPIGRYKAPANGNVRLWWGAAVGASGYDIYRGSDPAHLYLIDTLVHQTTQYSDPGDTWTDTGTAPAGTVPPATMNTASTPGQWQAKWGGRILNVSTNPGYFQNLQGPSGNVLESNTWGATASSLPLAAGLITLADLASGQINHAIALNVPQAAAGVYDCPAQRTDGQDTSPGAIPEGAHFRLDPTLDLSTLTMPSITRMIAQAAQSYGLIVNDQTNSDVAFRAEDPTPLIQAGQPNPYATYFGGRSPSQFLVSFPWSHLQLLAPPASCQ